MIQSNNFFIKNGNFIFDDDSRINSPIINREEYYILNKTLFEFSDEKNSVIKKQVKKQLGKRSNLWK